MVNPNQGTSGTKEISKRWPIETGLIAGTTKQTGRVMSLIPQGLHGVKTRVLQKDRELI